MGKACPACGLFNPESAQRCDCGFNFSVGASDANNAQLMSRRRLGRLRLVNGIFLGLLVLGGGSSTIQAFSHSPAEGVGALVGVLLVSLPFIYAFQAGGANSPAALQKRALRANWILAVLLIPFYGWLVITVGFAALLSILFWAIPMAMNIKALTNRPAVAQP